MSISTGSGDDGKTSLWSGERVYKDDIRVEAYGTIDELSSHIAEAFHFCKSEDVRELLLELQRALFKVAGQLASKSKTYTKPVSERDVQWLTDRIHYFEDKLNLTGFVILGMTIQSAKLDVCRTVTRRAERRIVNLSRTEDVSRELMKFVNRLSDLFFVLARYEEFLEGKLTYMNEK
ncbi:cob(I)yrinic acid a,c-diamide adenosyltransferase [Kosmotoga pacifica]|uniref:Corrinoid adenosyltransferase n=1 Tax=Kosmotoga pacifica TaxID=1330330 RepID=A0A0G2ZEK5_9BACT|nr:cob(I)yrinic acid a,c-diamide adenosyltransferase [Kosmotoga pacifica]AKI97974.1 ATP--cobalamin adenosyltransferase [Kosmotoga pacifica]